MKTLAYCVSLVQNDRDDFSPRNRSRYLQFAINTYREEISFGAGKSVEVMYATPDSIGCVDMPQDYEYYTKVAILLGGVYYTLTLNPNMALNRRMECAEDIQDSDTSNWAFTVRPSDYGYGFNFAGHYRAGNYVGELYGLGGGFNAAGYFAVDEKLRRFQFSNVPFTEVVIEYVSNKAGEGSLIDDLAIPVIRYGIHNQINLFDAIMQAEKDRFHGLFKQAVLDYRVRSTTPTLEEYLDSQYKTFKSSPKR